MKLKKMFTLTILLSSIILGTSFVSQARFKPQNIGLKQGPQKPKPPVNNNTLTSPTIIGTYETAADYANLYLIASESDEEECYDPKDQANLAIPLVRVDFQIETPEGLKEPRRRCVPIGDTIFLYRKDFVYHKWGNDPNDPGHNPEGEDTYNPEFNSFILEDSQLEAVLAFYNGNRFRLKTTSTGVHPIYDPNLDASDQSEQLMDGTVVRSYTYLGFKSDCYVEGNTPLCPSYQIFNGTDYYIRALDSNSYGEVFVNGNDAPVFEIYNGSLVIGDFHTPNNGVFRINLLSL